MFFSRYGCIVGALAAVAAVSLWANTARTTESDPVDQGVSGQPQPNTDIVQPSDAHPPKSPLRLSTIDYQDAGDKPGKLTVAGVALPGRELSLFLDDQPFTNTAPRRFRQLERRKRGEARATAGTPFAPTNTTRTRTCWRLAP